VFQGDYIRHPVLYELSHKYGLPTENISDSQLSSKLEELKGNYKKRNSERIEDQRGCGKIEGSFHGQEVS
jgi:hypothetical protein